MEYERAAREYYIALQDEAYRLDRIREVQVVRQGEASIDLLSKIHDVLTTLEATKRTYRALTGRELETDA